VSGVARRKKSKKGHGGHHGGAWKVAYADFVTAMMALFMVLWLVSQTDQDSREKLADYFRTGVFSGGESLMPGGNGMDQRGYLDANGPKPADEQVAFEKGAEAVRKAIAAAGDDDPELKKLLDNVRVETSSEGLLINVVDGGDDLLFDVSSDNLKPALVAFLAKIGPTLGDLHRGIEIQGHTDARPFAAGSSSSNWELSFRRADKARAELLKHGIAAEQISGVHAYGSTRLFVPTEPMSAANRRLTILARRDEPQSGAGEVKPTKGSAPERHSEQGL
jgi:chemotaxis protein MotB